MYVYVLTSTDLIIQNLRKFMPHSFTYYKPMQIRVNNVPILNDHVIKKNMCTHMWPQKLSYKKESKIMKKCTSQVHVNREEELKRLICIWTFGYTHRDGYRCMDTHVNIVDTQWSHVNLRKIKTKCKEREGEPSEWLTVVSPWLFLWTRSSICCVTCRGVSEVVSWHQFPSCW